MLQVRWSPATRDAGRGSPAAGRGNSHGGTVANVVFGLVLVLLLGLALWWVFKNIGEAGQQYSQVLVDTKYTAITVRCQTNMRTIWQNLQMYAAANGKFPESKDALMEWSENSRLFRCPATDGPEYMYIPGQNPDMPATNSPAGRAGVLVYEPRAVHDGRCSVLRLGGQVELLTPEELKLAVAATLARRPDPRRETRGLANRR